jgi:hypothetical protein
LILRRHALTIDVIITAVNVAPFTILHGIRKSDIFKHQLLARFPSLAADVHSFYGNPNCSCKNNIIKTVRENYDNFKHFIEEFVVQNPSIDITDIPNMGAIPDAPKMIAGETYTIHKDELKTFYSNFLVKERCTYKSCTIVPEGDNLRLYFL